MTARGRRICILVLTAGSLLGQQGLRRQASPDNTPPGEAARGMAIFEGKGGCLSCHRVKNHGSRFGPDLTDIGKLRRASDLERSILEPDAEVLPQYRFYRVVTRDGATIIGRLLDRDTFTVQLIDSKEQLWSFVRSTLREDEFVAKSPMPSYQSKLSTEELGDLVNYLMSLKGFEKP